MTKKGQPAVKSSSGTGDTASMGTAGDSNSSAGSSETSMPGQEVTSTQVGQLQPGTNQADMATSDAALEGYLGNFGRERALRVSATRDGYRRAGRSWSRTPETVPLSDFTDEQVQQLVDDPHLAVSAGYLTVDGESAE